MALTTSIKVVVDALLTASGDLGNASAPLNYEKTIAFASGTGANQADKLWHDQRTITGSNSETLDLAGALSDLLGTGFTLAELRFLLIYAAAANGDSITVAREGTNGVPLFSAAGDAIIIPPGGLFLWSSTDGTTTVDITAGTGDLIEVTNLDTASITYDVIVGGASA